MARDVSAIFHSPSSILRDFDGQSGCGAVQVGKHPRARGNQCFHARARGHRPVARNKKVFDAFGDRSVFDQRFAEQLGDQIAREVVGCGAKSAGGDDEVGAGQRFTHGLLDIRTRVRHGDLPADGVAEVGQAAAKPLLMGVEDAAQQEFTAGVDEFDDHARKFRVTAGGWQDWSE